MQQDHDAPPTTSLSTNQRILQSIQRPLVQYLLLYLVVMSVFVPTFWYTFVWDDWEFIARNKSLREWKHIPSYFTDPNTFSNDPGDKSLNAWRPLRNIYYLVTYKIHGLHPAGWHFHHVLIHSLLAAMLLAVFHRLYRYAMAWNEDDILPVTVQLATWLSVLIWAVHPVNTEVTAWLKSADDILACIFTAAALLLLFPRNHQLTLARAILAAAVFSLALLAKESIAPIPLIYAALVTILAPDRPFALRQKSFWFATALLFACLVVYMAFRKNILGQIEQVPYVTGSFSSMMATMTTAIVRYLQLTFWPFWPTVQVGDYLSWPLENSWSNPRVISSICIIILASLPVFFVSRLSKVFAAGWVFALLAFSPVSNIVPMMQVLAERFLYFPLIGIALALAAVLVWILRQSMHLLWIPVMLVTALTLTTHLRLPVWVTEQNFQKATAEAIPDSWRATYNLALSEYQDGNTTAALAKALETLHMAGSEPAAVLVVTILLKEGNVTSATAYLEKVKKAFPDSARPYLISGSIAQAEDRSTDALNMYREAVKREPKNAAYHFYVAQMADAIGDTDAAIDAAQKSIHLDSDLSTATEFLKYLKAKSNE